MERELVQMCTKELGDFNPMTAKMLSNLGSTLLMMNKNSESEETLLRALKIHKIINGPVDNSVATTHNFLAMLYRNNMKNYAAAEENYKLAIKIRLELFGPDYSQLQFDYNGMIALYKKTGDDTKMKEYKQKKKEWQELQKKDNVEEEEEEKEEEKEMNFEETIAFVLKN